MTPDFSGWATRAGVLCSDGKTIMPNAFEHQDGKTVPLVWQHGHNDVKNVLGHAVLRNRPEGVWAEAFFNETEAAQHAKQLLIHGDINRLSIWANQLTQRAKQVFHGMIREVSLVMAGANPGAVIENVTIRHSDGEEEVVDDEAIIYTDEPLELTHADVNAGDGTSGASDGPTVQDVFDSMSEEQQAVTQYLVGQALAAGKAGSDSAAHSDTDTTADGDTKEGDPTIMSHNVFEKGTEGASSNVLSHDDMQAIFADAQRPGNTLKSAVERYAADHLEHGISDISSLFPEEKSLNGAAPEFFTRRMEWVQAVLSACGKSPFSRVKTVFADLTYDDARAKGYIKGNLKKEQWFPLFRRTTSPKTIYKKQKLDRDDILDITDFDVVAWIKGDMRLMLDEELARAILIGDGRDGDDEDKITEENIRPIATDDDLYAIKVNINLLDASSSIDELTDAVILNTQYLRGSGQPDFYTSATVVARYMLLKDGFGRRMYTSKEQVAAALGVGRIVVVDVFDADPTLVGIVVNLADYNIGADKGGQVTMFDDFDIDYNQEKFLIETRVSGALKRIRSALVIRQTATNLTLVTPSAPTWDATEKEVTIVTTANVTYKNKATDAAMTAGSSPYAVDPGEVLTVVATAAAGYYLSSSVQNEWSFYNSDEA